MADTTVLFLVASAGALAFGTLVMLTTLISILSRDPRQRQNARKILELLIHYRQVNRRSRPSDQRKDRDD